MVSTSTLLEFGPNHQYKLLKKYNLENPDRMNEALDILESWIQKQNHFLKKDFARFYLKTCLITCKGSIEKAKERMESQCTLRSLLPDFYGDFDPRTIKDEDLLLYAGISTKLDDNLCRTFISKLRKRKFSADKLKKSFLQQIMLGEYIRLHDDATDGFILLFDITEVSMSDIIPAFNLVDGRNMLSLVTKGYGMRLKGIHILFKSSSKTALINLVWTFVRSILSKKLAKRVHFHDSLQSLHKHFTTKDVLPVEYGGKEKPVEVLYANLVDAISSPEHLAYMTEISKAGVNEALRISNKLNEEHLGLPGSFRRMVID